MTQTIKIRILEGTNKVYQFESFQINDSVYFPFVSVKDILKSQMFFNISHRRCDEAHEV